jgi:hypothetical protein
MIAIALCLLLMSNQFLVVEVNAGWRPLDNSSSGVQETSDSLGQRRQRRGRRGRRRKRHSESDNGNMSGNTNDIPEGIRAKGPTRRAKSSSETGASKQVSATGTIVPTGGISSDSSTANLNAQALPSKKRQRGRVVSRRRTLRKTRP